MATRSSVDRDPVVTTVPTSDEKEISVSMTSGLASKARATRSEQEPQLMPVMIKRCVLVFTGIPCEPAFFTFVSRPARLHDDECGGELKKSLNFLYFRCFRAYIFIRGESFTPMKKPGGQKTFGTSISFDLDLSPGKKTRRNKRTEATSPSGGQPAEHEPEVDCPGCGATISQASWIQALVGFVSGARRYDMGETVPGNVVQTLRNTVSNMDLPHPVNVWELGIVNRLTQEFDLLLQEGIEGRFPTWARCTLATRWTPTLNVFAWKRWPPLNSNFGTGLRPMFERPLSLNFDARLSKTCGNSSTQNWNGVHKTRELKFPLSAGLPPAASLAG